MPRIKRWFPVSHSFNRDPEIRQLRLQFADWMGYVWAEMCSIGDMNDGIVKGSPEQIGESLAYISLTKRPSLAAKCITNALGFMQVCGWIEIQMDRVLIVNHWKYHRIEERKPVPPDLTEPEPEPKRSKKISFPLDYKLNETLIAWCLQQYVSDPSPHLEAFKDFHVAKGSRFADWDAAFRNWIRNSARFNGRGTVTKLQPEGELSERTQRILRRGL